MRNDLEALLRTITRQELERVHRGELAWETVVERMAAYGRYGFANVLLIGAQREVTDVRTFEEWKAAGRRVRKGEHAIRVLSRQGKPRSVFDLAQTSGPETVLGTADRPAWQSVKALATSRRLFVDRGSTWSYLGDPSKRVVIPPGLDDDAAALFLAHQLAHMVLHRGELDDGSRVCAGIGKVEADSVAAIVARELGLPITPATAPVSSWAGTDPRSRPLKTIEHVGGRILRAAAVLRRDLQKAANEPTAEAKDRSAAEEPTAEPPDRALLEALKAAHLFFVGRFPTSWAPGYLTRRGFPEAYQLQRQAGYAPNGWRGLLDALTSQGFPLETLVEAGLVKVRNGRAFDVFRDRLVVPVRSEHGEVVGFIGRAAPGDTGPKYLNSPETPVYKKGALLYGLHEAAPKLAAGARPVIVEGVLDAWAIDLSSDAHAAVAPSGTALTEDQVGLLAGAADLTTRGPLLALDGDTAGRRATARVWKAFTQVSGNVGAICFPDSQDPADLFLHHGPVGVRHELAQERDLIEHVLDAAIAEGLARGDPASALRTAAEAIIGLGRHNAARHAARVAQGLDIDPREVTRHLINAASPPARASETFPLAATTAHTDPPPPTPKTRHDSRSRRP
ncbi:DNA primase [Actinocorallia herbida]|uniref:DNA primase n=1 Tax=Actinocorallia herbida TaxID=58109 RepID=A0A3N1D3G9_9ACTN|nr:toprim domain-containing protein [Actinocorallia herbida]ROO88083.1 DNA primase [Actinocorallia herbida]